MGTFAASAQGASTSVRDTWRGRLAGVPPRAQSGLLLDLIAARIAAVAGRERPGTAEEGAPWRRLGIVRERAEQLVAELRTATGLALGATLLFDHPTPGALAEHLREELLGVAQEPGGPAPEGRGQDPDDPIAIVAMACRFPGGVVSPEELWNLVDQGRDAIGPVPEGRGWSLDPIHHPDQQTPGAVCTREGGFLEGVELFDPAFFGIGPREATALDPQQRLMLEVSWEAFERAGIDARSLHGSRTGVFVGIAAEDYGPAWYEAPPEFQGAMLTGNSRCVASGRIAYTFGLEGPALTVDTACSSSLVAVHLACQSLRARECDLALAGGATVMSTPGVMLEFSRKGGLSPDGRCKAFSARADGAGFAEGAAALLLERLSDARQRGHPVLALVRGSAVNQDGASNGLTAPSGSSQRRLIRQALANAGLRAADIDVVEAHGTGTILGDAVEAQALLAAFGRDRPPGRPLWVGSVKSNIGHTLAAAGAAGIIKTVMAMRHGVLPPTLHADPVSGHVDWAGGGIALLTAPAPWQRTDRPRRAGVSAFGVSGTNAHAVLEEPPVPVPVPFPDGVRSGEPGADARTTTHLPVVVSGRNEAALREQAARLGGFLEEHPEVGLMDAGFSLAGRTRFDCRAVAAVAGRAGLVRSLRALAAGETDPGSVSGSVRPGGSPRKVAFLFTGQGSQRPGMGRGLHTAFPVFASALDEVCSRLDGYLHRSLRDLMFAPEGSADAELLHRTAFTQPALFAFEVALFRLTESWGLVPDLVLGHSIGELTAAYLAGLWSLEDACALVAARGRLMQSCPAGGAMSAVQAGEGEVLSSLAGFEGRAGIAAVNGPTSTVIAGDTEAVAKVTAFWDERGRATKRLNVSHAFHSPHMDGMLTEFRRVARSVTYRLPTIPLVSNLTGAPAQPAQLRSPEYWVRHVREPVRFLDGMRSLHREEVTAFLELGPDAVLTPMAAACPPGGDPDPDLLMAAASRAGRPEDRTLVMAAAELHVRGVPMDVRTVFAERGGRHVELPGHPFQRGRYWLEIPRLAALAGRPSGAAGARRYLTTWKPLTGDPTGSPAMTGSWLLLTPPGRLADGLAARLARIAARADVRVHVLPLTGQDTDRNRMAALLDKHLAAEGGAVDGVLSLLALDPTPHAAHPSVTHGLALTLATVQALADLDLDLPLWCVTRGAVGVDAADPAGDPAQAMVWGLGRTAALERSRSWGGLIDLPADPDDRALGLLCTALAARDGEDQLAVRDTGLLARRVVEAGPAGTEPGQWRPRGTVLITGGTGALGAHTARWLARNGAPRLVLAGRRGMNAPGAPELLAELAALGARAGIVSCDVADRDSLAHLLASLPDDQPLTAVVHAAGVSGSPAPVTELSVGAFADTVSAKAAGAAHLDGLLGDARLDAFVMFSSVSGVWGSGGQGAYAAGNAFLDALAHRRRSRGLTATSVAWGPWAGSGMAADPAVRDHLRERGLLSMEPSAALPPLWQAVAAGQTALTVADIDWETFLPLFTGARTSRLFEQLSRAPAAAPAPDASVTEPATAARLRGLTGGERTAALLDLVRTQAAAVLGHSSAQDIDPERRFLELGFDSLASVQLRQRLSSAIGLTLPAPVVFEYPTATELAGYLDAALESPALTGRPAPPPAADPAPDSRPTGLRHLYRHGCVTGRHAEAVRLLKAAAKLRPVFHDADEYDKPLELIKLASGPAAPALVCLPSMIAPSGAHNFARLSLHLDGLRELYVLPHPGFGDDEPLPASAAVVIDQHAEVLARRFRGTPFALAGYSAGGCLAHAVASRLEELGTAPAAVVLLDTLAPDHDIPEEQIQRQIRRIAVSDQAFALMTDAQLTAQGHYLDVFHDWRPAPLAAPLLLVRSTGGIPREERIEGEADGVPWSASWGFSHEMLEVPGDHVSIMNEDAGSTARSVHAWLDRV